MFYPRIDESITLSEHNAAEISNSQSIDRDVFNAPDGLPIVSNDSTEKSLDKNNTQNATYNKRVQFTMEDENEVSGSTD